MLYPDDLHPQQSALAMSDFVSLAVYESLPLPLDTVSLVDFEVEAVESVVLLARVDTTCFHCTRTYDPDKPPNTYREALARPDVPVWQAAMQHEYDSLESHNSFECTTLPKGRKAIGLRWVYTFKYNPDGSIIRGKEKGCVVAQGFSQRPEDFGETYAPVAKMTSICILLAFANDRDLEVFTFDCKTAFLHARCTHVLYCKQSLAFLNRILLQFCAHLLHYMVYDNPLMNSTCCLSDFSCALA